MGEATFDPPVEIVHLLPLASSYIATESFQRVARWWRTTRSGVCCLAGIGGSGKTATADQLLRQLGVLIPLPAAGSLSPPPGAAFAFTLSQGSAEALAMNLRR